MSCFWLLRLDSKADGTGGMGNFRVTFYSSLWQIKGTPLLLGGDPVLASSIETPQINTASQEDRTLTLGFFFFFIFKLYIIVLVLPNIKMNPPQVYMCSPS